MIYFPVAVVATLFASIASAIPQQECLDTYLPARLACYDTEGPCDPLPIPDFAFPQIEAGENGYAIQVLRSSDYTHVYHVTEFSYQFMVVLDMPEADYPGHNGTKSASSKKNSYDADRLLVNMKPKSIKERSGGAKTKKLKKKGGGSDKVSVAIIDFPTGSFEQRNETGAVVGSLVTTAVDEILFDIEGFTTDDIGDVYMILSHNHMDHVGAASITLEHIETNWGKKSVDAVAADSVADTYERLIELGLFSYRAPIPNVLVSHKTTLKVGRNTKISLDLASGHSLDHQDLIVFLEKEDDDSPAILMLVDVVFPKWVPFFEFALTTDLAEFLAIHDTLLGYPLGDDGIYVGGHLNQVGARTDIVINQNFTWAVMEAAAAAFASVDIGPIAGASGVFDPSSTNYGNSWLLFGGYFDELNRVCAKAVVAEYGCKLAAVDITVESACNVAQSFWRIEA